MRQAWLDRLAWVFAGALCIAYVAAGLAHSAGRPIAFEDSIHNAILARNLARDLSYTVQVVQYHVGSFDEVEHVPEMHGLLQPLLLAAAFRLAGPDEELIRVPGYLFAGATALLGFALARRLFGPLPGIAACALVLLNPGLSHWAWVGTDDVGFTFFFLVALALTLRALETGRTRCFVAAGLAGGLAALQKPTGILLPVVFVAAALVPPRAPLGRAAARYTILVGPALLGIAAYFARNLVGHGSLSFRWGAIDWLYKSEGLSAYFRPYDAVPGLVEVMQSLGAAEVGRILWEQLVHVLEALFPLLPFAEGTPPLVTPGIVGSVAILALPWLWRAQPAFVALTSLTLVSLMALLGLGLHYEPRYLLPLLPLLAIAFGGLLARGLDGVGAGRLRLSVQGACIAIVLGLTGSAIRAMEFRPVPGRPIFNACREATDWIRHHTEAGDRILSFDPWRVTWTTDRPGIVLPSGTRADVERITRRYEPRWLVLHLRHSRRSDFQVVQAMLGKPGSPFPAEPAFRGRLCSVFPVREVFAPR